MDMNQTVTHDLTEILHAMHTDAAGFVESEEARYEQQIENTAEKIAEATHGCQLIWQCGPSSVGKTTTAKKLRAALSLRGLPAFVVSMDDFYRGAGKAPRLEDGSFDYESPHALDLPAFRRCIEELLTTGETLLPRYDFAAGMPAHDKTLLSIKGDAVVIFEGIHAFSPLLTDGIDMNGARPLRLFVNTRSRFTDGDEMLLCRRDIRLSRRLLRDERTRASSFENTMTMWQQVLKGDERYIFPYTHAPDLTIDTTIGYEPCVLAPLLLSKLPSLFDTPFEAQAKRLNAAYVRFEPLCETAVPEDSLLREFIG